MYGLETNDVYLMPDFMHIIYFISHLRRTEKIKIINEMTFEFNFKD
jgi:hypothetical protein